MKRISKEHLNVAEQLKELIVLLRQGKFEGALYHSNIATKGGFFLVAKGSAADRLGMIDYAMLSMQYEANKESRDWFFTQVYEKFRGLRPDTALKAT